MSGDVGFTVDLSGCIGCKACQVACQDQHGLSPGRLYRRVVEVSGGGWAREGGVPVDGSYAYFVSVACMHCEWPICVELCPTKAMARDADGIVAVDPDRCIGCRYCEWACPYAAPQYDAARGVMTKCDFCRDRRAEGRGPACVEACPMRVLGAGAPEAGEGSATFPLPPPELTRPRAVLRPHRDTARAEGDGPWIGNREEIG